MSIEMAATLDPLLPFKFVSMKGGNAQIAVVGRKLGERLISDTLLPFWVGSGKGRSAQATAPFL